MNINHRIRRTAAFTLAAGMLAGSGSFAVLANPTAGVSSYTADHGETDDAENAPAASTMSGVSLLLSNIVTDSRKTAESNAAAKAAAEAAAEKEAAEAAATEAAQYANIGIANVSDFVYVRSAADENSDYVGKLYSNAAATVNGEENGWYSITSGDVTGYVRKDFLSVGDQATIKAASREVATVNTTTLYVRSEPSTESSVLTLVPGTEDLTVTDDSMQDQGWVKVSVEEGEGYVSTDYVVLSRTYTYAESKEAEQARIAAEEAEREAAAAAARASANRSSSRKSSSSGSSSSKKTYAAAGSGTGSSVASYAAQFIGNPYVYGGTSLTNGADCSGFVQSVYAAFGVSLPHSSSADRSVGYGVSTSEMQPGDIVCYSGHVGIYAGNGLLINASSPSTGIKYSNVYYHNILAVRRIF